MAALMMTVRAVAVRDELALAASDERRPGIVPSPRREAPRRATTHVVAQSFMIPHP